MSCNVCNHPQRAEIDYQIAHGARAGTLWCIYRVYSITEYEEHMRHVGRSVAEAREGAVARVRRVEQAGWDLYERALGANVPDLNMANKALQTVRSAIDSEAALIPQPKQLSPQQNVDDFGALLRLELRGNPQLARTVLAQLAPAEIHALMRPTASLTVVDSPVAAELSSVDDGNCTEETARAAEDGPGKDE